MFFIALEAAAQTAPDASPALAGYRPWQDAPPTDWVRANQAVHEAGGWRAYAREAAAARRAPAAGAEAAQPTRPDVAASAPRHHHAAPEARP